MKLRRKLLLMTCFVILIMNDSVLSLLTLDSDTRNPPTSRLEITETSTKTVSLLDSLLSGVTGMIGFIGRFIEEQIENLMSSLLARTETYFGSLQQRFNITNVIDSITFVKENKQSKLENNNELKTV